MVTPEFRVAFPAVFKAKRNELSGQDEYSVVALFPKGADLSPLMKAAEAAIAKKWPDIKLRPKNLRSPFRDQGEREKTLEDGRKQMPDGYEKGAMYLNLKSKERPGVVDSKVQPILDASDFYSGCYARADISCYAYDKAGNRGVSFGLSNLQKTRDGEAFSGRAKAENAFAPIEGSEDLSEKSSIFGS